MYVREILNLVRTRVVGGTKGRLELEKEYTYSCSHISSQEAHQNDIFLKSQVVV